MTSKRTLVFNERARNELRVVVALTVAFCAFCAFCESTRAQTPTPAQLSIGTDTILSSVEDTFNSIYFTGPYALTLVDGQTLRAVLVTKDVGSELHLGDGVRQGESWRLVANSPSWVGTIDVGSGNTLEIAPGVANPVGAYAQNNLLDFGKVNLYNGSIFKLPASDISALGIPLIGETQIGALSTDGINDSLHLADATVDVGIGQTLTVNNGLYVDAPAGLTKVGSGTLQFLVNGTERTLTTYDGVETITDVTNFNFGNTTIANGTLTLKSGAMDIRDADVRIDSFYVGSGATLDIQYAGAIELQGSAGDVVFAADDGSTINLFVDEFGSTSYVATTYNTYMLLGATTLNVDASVRGSQLPETMTVLSTRDVGQILFDDFASYDDILVVDNLLGKSYVVDEDLSTAEELVLKLKIDKGFGEIGATPNERALGSYLDRFVASDNYNDEEYLFLSALELGIDNGLSFRTATGELHASTVGFMYMNNFATTQTLFDMLRNNALVAYSGERSVAPMDYGGGNYGRNGSNRPNGYFGGPQGVYDQGPLYYNNDTNSYGPGVVPIGNTGAYSQQSGFNVPYEALSGGVYNGESYGSGVGGMSGGSFQGDGGYNGGVYNGGYNGSYNTYDSGYNFGWNGPREKSALELYRGQETTYGDPGTLIYSAWLAALGGAGHARVHKDAYGYNSKQAGFILGLDLFCSCDCRFGAYYTYQNNQMKNYAELGKVKTHDHQIGLYHQFGDETVYSIASIRGGYDRYKTFRSVHVYDFRDDLSAKYRGWNAGASFEHGANFAAKPFVFSPYASVDYNFFYRNKFTESSAVGSYFPLHVGKSNYHSLRGQIGGRVALDMYPGSQQLRLVLRAAYMHEFLNPMYGKTMMSFAELPNATGGFNVYGNSLGRDWAVIGGGLDWTPVPALVLFAKGDYVFNKYLRDPYCSAGLKYCW